MTLNSVPSIDLLRKAHDKLKAATGGNRAIARCANDWSEIDTGLAILELVIESEAAMQAVSAIVMRRPTLEDFGRAAE